MSPTRALPVQSGSSVNSRGRYSRGRLGIRGVPHSRPGCPYPIAGGPYVEWRVRDDARPDRPARCLTSRLRFRAHAPRRMPLLGWRASGTASLWNTKQSRSSWKNGLLRMSWRHATCSPKCQDARSRSPIVGRRAASRPGVRDKARREGGTRSMRFLSRHHANRSSGAAAGGYSSRNQIGNRQRAESPVCEGEGSGSDQGGWVVRSSIYPRRQHSPIGCRCG
jgi:hypothetical protein